MKLCPKEGGIVGLYQCFLNSLIVLKITGVFDKNFKTPEPCSPPACTLGLLHLCIWALEMCILHHQTYFFKAGLNYLWDEWFHTLEEAKRKVKFRNLFLDMERMSVTTVCWRTFIIELKNSYKYQGAIEKSLRQSPRRNVEEKFQNSSQVLPMSSGVISGMSGLVSILPKRQTPSGLRAFALTALWTWNPFSHLLAQSASYSSSRKWSVSH